MLRFCVVEFVAMGVLVWRCWAGLRDGGLRVRLVFVGFLGLGL